MIFLRALSVFLGTVIGVGIFGLPFVAAKAGFLIILFYFLIMALVVFWVHWLYSEVVLGTKGVHRLSGYVSQYLGKKWKNFSFFVIFVGLGGTLLAYLIVGGKFLHFSLGSYFGGSVLFYTLLFFILAAYLVFRGIKSISQIELSLLIILLFILIVFLIKSFSLIDIGNFKNIDFNFFIFPYGVVLFSLWGSAVIPEIKEMITKKVFSKSDSEKKDLVRKKLKKVIVWGIILSAFIYLSFIFIVLGISGVNTSKEAISGLGIILGSDIIKLGFIFGIITCFTSFLTLALTFKKMLWYDFGINKNISWAISCFLPLALFLLGMREFIEIIGLTGAVALGLEGVIIIFLYRQFLKKKFSKKINPAFYLLVAVFSLGIIFETIYFLIKI